MASAPWVWPPVQVDEITLPITSDQVTNLSSVAGADVTVALDSLGTASNTLSANLAALALQVGTYPYIVPPATPNAFDDEFSSGSADLATRGYTIVNATTGVAQTRSGDIAPWGAAPAAGTYFSTIIGSWIFLQAPAGIQLDIYKTIALAAGDVYYARMSGSWGLAPGANGRFNELGLFGAAGATLDNNNRVYATVRDDTTAPYLVYDAGRITGGGAFTGASKNGLGGHDIHGVHFDSGTTHVPFYVDSQNGDVAAITVAGTPVAATLTRFGIRNQFSTSGSTAQPQIWGIDFIRKKTGGAWLIS